MNYQEKLDQVFREFNDCRDILTAIGDETRQAIIMTLIGAECYPGIRVGEITERTHLSRPAISHHLKILKEAGIICMREIGTMNFYYIEPDKNKIALVKQLFQHTNELL